MFRILKKFKDSLYNICVRRVSEIQLAYEGYVNANKESHKKNRLKSWSILLRCNIKYYIFKTNPKAYISNSEIANVYDKASESSLSYRKTPEHFAEELMAFDIISFDIFDTLVFRPFQNPTDLFYILGEKHCYPDFKRLRCYAEAMARNEKFKTSNTYEISIDDIYEYMEKHIGISAELGIKLETETEIELCFANPYMKKVFNILRQNGKKIIAVSDMYLKHLTIEQLLSKCGYTGFDEVYISCEHLKSKYDGKMFQLVKNNYGKEISYAHIGDNKFSDIKRATENGFNAFFYPNVNETGVPQRSTSMSIIVGSAYKGIVNSHLHNGLNLFKPAYEYGYVCGGIFVAGYCRFIHEYAGNNGIDKILFLSRDGFILKKAYDILYPNNNSGYVYWSRAVSTKLTAKRFKYNFFEKFIYHKINSNKTLKNIVEAMELWELFENDNIIDWDLMLTDKTVKLLEQQLNNNWDKIIEIYNSQSQGAKKYYAKVLNGCKKVCAVDVGWAGSGAISLSYLVENEWDLGCEITGLIAGTNTPHNVFPDTSESQLQSQKLVSYMYSQSFNRELAYFHNPNSNHNIYFEFLLSSCEGSVKGFYSINGGYEIQFGEKEKDNLEVVKLIQQGIMDFINQYKTSFEKCPYMFNISGNDAYVAFRLAVKNQDYLRMLFSDCTFQMNVGEENKSIIKKKRRK